MNKKKIRIRSTHKHKLTEKNSAILSIAMFLSTVLRASEPCAVCVFRFALMSTDRLIFPLQRLFFFPNNKFRARLTMKIFIKYRRIHVHRIGNSLFPKGRIENRQSMTIINVISGWLLTIIIEIYINFKLNGLMNKMFIQK